MGIETWTALATASAVLLLIPGCADAAFLPRAASLAGSFVGLAALHVLPAVRRSATVTQPRVRRGFNRTSDAMPIGAGLITATMRKG
jgi:threonine/homoserine/homoserine lactone efflux protein